MKNIEIPLISETPYFPSVTFDFEKGECVLAGESYMEDCFAFYTPLVDWLTVYCQQKRTLVFHFKLYYFNTQSSRMLLKIIEVLMKFKAAGGEPIIYWYYMQSDPDMVEEIEDFERESGLDINKIEING